MLRGKDRGGRGKEKGKGGRGKGEDRLERDVFSLINGNCYWGENGSEPLLGKIEEQCSSFTCSDNPSCDARWQNMVDEDFMIEGCPEEGLTDEKKDEFKAKMQEKKEIWKNMSKDERDELKQEKKFIRESNAATVLSLGCGCCGETGSDLSDLVRGKEGAVARTLGFRRPKGEGGGLLGQLGNGEGGGLLSQFGNGEGGGMLSQFGNGGGGGMLGQLGNGAGGDLVGKFGSGEFMNKMLDKKCPSFIEDNGCDEEEPDCTIFDTMTMKRGRQGGPVRKYMLRCGCCSREGGDP